MGLSEILDKFNAEEETVAITMPQFEKPDTLASSENYQKIVELLHQHPILVAPTLEWIRGKVSEMAMAELKVLYTDEQITEMQKEISK